MDESGGFFQICLAKDFALAKGRERLLSLGCLSELPVDVLDPATSDSDTASNAYDFMQRRRAVTGDPTQRKWNASIRLGNFASLEASPLCVSFVSSPFFFR